MQLREGEVGVELEVEPGASEGPAGGLEEQRGGRDKQERDGQGGRKETER